MGIIIQCLILCLSLIWSSQSWATTAVMRFPTGTPVQVCGPSDSSPFCSGGGGVGVGTVNTGSKFSVAYYANTGTTISGASNFYNNGNNVGIGSINPVQALDVTGTVRAQEMDFSTANGVIQGLNVAGGKVTIRTGNSSTISGDFLVITPPGSGGVAGSEYFLPGDGGSNVGGSIIGKAGNAGAAGNQAPGIVKFDGGNDLGAGILPDGSVLLQTVTTGGNVGIGSTVPTGKLDVSGTSYFSSHKFQFVPLTSTSSYFFQQNPTSGYGVLQYLEGGGDYDIYTTQNLSNPASGGAISELILNHDGSASLNNVLNGGGFQVNIDSGISAQNVDGFGFAIDGSSVSTINSNGDMSITSESGKILLSAAGNVGINSLSPGKALDVLGTVRATHFIGDGSGITGISGSGSVTSVAATVPSDLSISGSPITTSGTLAISYSGTARPILNGGTGATTALAASSNLSYHPFGTSNGETGMNGFVPAFIGQIGEDDFNTGPFWYMGKRTNGYTFVVSSITTSPAVNDTYTNNGVTFTVKEVGSLTGTSGSISGTINCTASGNPAASGNLTRTSGSGDATIAFSAFNYQFDWTDANNANNFATGISVSGNPDIPALNSDITRTTFYVDASPALRLNGGASGDSGLEVVSFNPNSYNSGTSLFLAVMGLDGSKLPIILDHVGASVAVVPANKIRQLIPGTMELVVNASATDMRAVTVSSPGISGFDTGNYSIQYNDVINDKFRIPWQRPGVYQVLDVNYPITVSGITTAPTPGTRYTNNGHKFDVVKVTLTGSAPSKLGTITFTGQEGAPTASGTLTKSTDINDKSGTGDATISFSAVSATTNTWKDALLADNKTGNIQLIGSLTGLTYDGSTVNYFTSGLSSIAVTNQGTGACVGTPSVTLTNGTVVTQGTATATVAGGLVTAIAVNTPGIGYTAPPTVTVSGASCSGVTAEATIGATPVIETSSLNQQERLNLANKAVILGSRTAFSTGPETIELVTNGTGLNVNPSFELEIGQAAYPHMAFANGNTTPLIRIQAASNFTTDNTYDFGDPTHRLRDLYVARNVGINTATPGKSLDVIGTVRATGFIGDGSLLTGVGGSVANPTATIGLTAVNGSATSAIRSDGAPALSQTISPTMTGNWAFAPSSGNTLFSAGNIGVGTPTPGQKLDIAGTVRAIAFNGLGVTTSTGTLTIANGKTATVNNTMTFAGTDSTTQTFQGSDTIVGRATTDTLTNKTFDTAGTGNQFFINGTAIGAVSGTGAVCLSAGSLCGGGGASGWTLGASNVGISTTNNVGIGTNLTTNAALSVMSGNVGIGTWKPSTLVEIGTQKVNVTTAGNIGLGITAPTGMIHVVQTAGVAGLIADDEVNDSKGVITLGKSVPSGTRQFSIYRQSSNLNLDNTTNSFNFNNTAQNDFIFNNASQTGSPTVPMLIRGAGNVGIGTSNPLGGLVVMSGNVGIGTINPPQGLSINGVIGFKQNAPTITSCGSTPSGSVVGNDAQGTITVGGTATGCTLSFIGTFGKSPHCNITNQSMSVTNAMTYTESTSGFVVSQAVGLSGDLLDYHCTFDN